MNARDNSVRPANQIPEGTAMIPARTPAMLISPSQNQVVSSAISAALIRAINMQCHETPGSIHRRSSHLFHHHRRQPPCHGRPLLYGRILLHENRIDLVPDIIARRAIVFHRQPDRYGPNPTLGKNAAVILLNPAFSGHGTGIREPIRGKNERFPK